MPLPPSRTESKDFLGAMTPRTTPLASRRIRDEWNEKIKAHSVFSARTTSQRYVEMVKKRLAEVASRQITPQQAEQRLRETLRDLGYSPEAGFKGDRTGAVPPARPGDIRDLSSSRRIQLILDTNVKQARSLGQIAASEDPLQLMMDPAWKLTRTGARKKPRGDWKRRWAAAGAACGWKGALKRQMVALKTSPIWQSLANGAGGFEDTLGSPYPPFAFGSGLAWVNVGRGEWKRMCAAEGVDSGLAEIAAKAKELKASAARPAQVGAVSRPDAEKPVPGLLGGFGAIAETIAGTPPEPKGENPLVEAPKAVAAPTPKPIPPGMFKASAKTRAQANDAVDDALQAIGRAMQGVSGAEQAIKKAEDGANELFARHPDSWYERETIAAAIRKYKAKAGDAAAELRSIRGRVANYGGAVESEPMPTDAASQAKFDEAMRRYAYDAREAARKAQAMADSASFRATAATRMVERAKAALGEA